MMMEESSDDEDISQLEDIAMEAQRIKRGIKALPAGGVEGDSDSDEEEEEEEDEDEEEEKVTSTADVASVEKRKLGDEEEVAAKKLKTDGSEEDSEDVEDSEDEDDSDDDVEEGEFDLDNIDTK